ncbi:MAG: acyltransferase family protein [Planctomycetaceae bacterium]|nr:acyltransferase family protein [Planctomycetaceae bacterium]
MDPTTMMPENGPPHPAVRTATTISGRNMIDRRHDLDALRAIAMLLGILLHAVLSFTPIPWTVQDSQQHNHYFILFAAIHGFRMPLFFMLSGFFTAMMWRKRGMRGLISQRLRRIALPLLLGCLTIVPAMWAVSFLSRLPSPGSSQNSAVWEKVVAGETEEVRHAIESAAIDVNATSQDGASLLTVAVFLGHTEMVEMLLQAGADVNQRNRDQGTALHSAAFVGRAEEANLLLQAGADIDAVDASGQSVRDLLAIDFGTTNFIATSYGLPLDEHTLLAGRAEIATLSGEDLPEGSLPPAAQRSEWTVVEAVLFQLPVFMHLWFLWFLCWLMLAFVISAPIASRLQFRKLPQWLVCSPISLLWLVPLTMLPQSSMSSDQFGPDSSIGLLPIPGVLAYYAVFFFFGSVYWEMDDSHGHLGRGWPVLLLIALAVVFPAGLDIVSGTFGIASPLIRSAWRPFVGNLLQALFAWLMTFGLIGMCRRLLSRESRTMRYISDSSYWLYLTHLPLILLAQWLVRDLNLPAILKLTGIVSLISALLLLTYEYGVRYTLIGRTLNGPRSRPV